MLPLKLPLQTFFFVPESPTTLTDFQSKAALTELESRKELIDVVLLYFATGLFELGVIKMDTNYPLLFVQNLFRDLIENVTLFIAALFTSPSECLKTLVFF